MTQRYKTQVALAALERLLLLKGVGILTESGSKGFLVYTSKGKEATVFAICACLDIITFFEKEYKDMSVVYDTKLEAGHPGLSPSDVVVAHFKGIRFN